MAAKAPPRTQAAERSEALALHSSANDRRLQAGLKGPRLEDSINQDTPTLKMLAV